MQEWRFGKMYSYVTNVNWYIIISHVPIAIAVVPKGKFAQDRHEATLSLSTIIAASHFGTRHYSSAPHYCCVGAVHGGGRGVEKRGGNSGTWGKFSETEMSHVISALAALRLESVV